MGIRGGIADVFISEDLLNLLGMPQDHEVLHAPSGVAKDEDNTYFLGMSVDPGNYDLLQPMRAVIAIRNNAGHSVDEGRPWNRITLRKN